MTECYNETVYTKSENHVSQMFRALLLCALYVLQSFMCIEYSTVVDLWTVMMWMLNGVCGMWDKEKKSQMVCAPCVRFLCTVRVCLCLCMWYLDVYSCALYNCSKWIIRWNEKPNENQLKLRNEKFVNNETLNNQVAKQASKQAVNSTHNKNDE